MVKTLCFQCRVKCVCAKSLQSCLTLFNPMDCSPPGSSVHGNSAGKNTGVGCHALLQMIFPGSNPHLLCLLHRQAGFLLLLLFCFVLFLPLVPPGKVSSTECADSTPGQGTKILHAVQHGQNFLKTLKIKRFLPDSTPNSLCIFPTPNLPTKDQICHL